MGPTLLHSPFLLVHLACVVALVLVAVYAGTSIVAPREDRARPTAPDQDVRQHWARPGNASLPARRPWALRDRHLLPLRELEAACTAEYAVRACEAIARIRAL